MKTIKILATALVAFACVVSFSATAKPVNLTPDVASVEFTVDGKKFTINRNQDNANLIDSNYAKTSRPCPPFCIRPIVLAPGVETIGELEVFEYLKKLDTDKNLMVIDSRTPDWVARGTIAGAVNIPWTGLDAKKGATELDIELIVIDEFGAKKDDNGKWDFSNAKTLVLFCNGMWCGQSPRNINTLLSMGYPAEKLKWYRGGMQTWHVLGLSTVIPN
jgi:rhodanese-related sulfurtransferase